ncbi:MAG: alcohol dehydrogenase catalytic domain-containing protein, partial [Chlamydiae bacterium]|nr:alcohol dehydrogenase catalytic domain-containing protein [Chlamydiota bacterium]
MKAIALFPKSGELKLIDHPEPKITHSNEVKIKVIGVGICGSDREMMEKKRAAPPPGEEHLILGHEMLGEVHEIGKDVR